MGVSCDRYSTGIGDRSRMYTCKSPDQKRRNSGFSIGLQSLDHVTYKLRGDEQSEKMGLFISSKVFFPHKVSK